MIPSLDLSRRLHNRFYADADQSLCARAYYKQHTSLRWLVFRVAADTLFLLVRFRPRHCKRSFDFYY